MHVIVIAIALIAVVLVVGSVGLLFWALMPRRRRFPDQGWYYDPTDRYTARYWTGTAWTSHVTHHAGMDAQHLEDPRGAV